MVTRKLVLELDAQGEALLAGVLARPDDDAPRLVMADWLEEQGQDARAELIRVQVEMALLKAKVMWDAEQSARYHALRRRERKLLRAGRLVPPQARHDWTGFEELHLPWDTVRWEWRRGFVERLTMPADDWVRYHAALLSLQPVRHVTLTTPLRFGIIGGRPGVAVFDGPAGSRMPPAEFIPADEDAPEEWLGDENGPPWIVSRLWPGIAFEHPPA